MRDLTVNLPQKVAVVGGGRMGAGIAHLFLIGGSDVTVVETDDSTAAGARDRIQRSVDRSAAAGGLNESPEAALGRLNLITSPQGLDESIDLAIEAVPESVDIKLPVLAKIEESVGASTVIATNTSSLSVNELAVALKDSTRFLGMHFFNPVPVSLLVEVVVAGGTSNSTVDTVVDWVKATGKGCITINDAPGFATSRLGLALGLEAIRMLEQGVASAEDIDRAMTLGYKHPIGPLKLTDIVGLDVRLGVAEYLAFRLGERFAPPELLRSMVDAGKIGRKAGAGFYDWSDSA